jgi:hypothetical protein
MSNEVNNFMVVIRSLLLLLVVVKLTAPLVGGSAALRNRELRCTIVNTAGCWALFVKIDQLSAQCPPNAFAGRWALSTSNERSIKRGLRAELLCTYVCGLSNFSIFRSPGTKNTVCRVCSKALQHPPTTCNITIDRESTGNINIYNVTLVETS